MRPTMPHHRRFFLVSWGCGACLVPVPGRAARPDALIKALDKERILCKYYAQVALRRTKQSTNPSLERGDL